MKHSAGPWKAFENGMGDTRIVNPHRLICECEFDGALDGTQFQANARLIAAAPELLAALRDLADCFWEGRPKRNTKRDYHLMVSVEAARQAMRKAEGGAA